jgi:hypothetical protein
MSRRQLAYSALVAVILTFAGIFFLDQPIAAFVQGAGGRQSPVLLGGTHWLEVAAGLPINRYFLTYLLLGIGALLFVAKNTRRIAWMLIFIATAQLVTRITAGVLKNVFDRLFDQRLFDFGGFFNFRGRRKSSDGLVHRRRVSHRGRRRRRMRRELLDVAQAARHRAGGFEPRARSFLERVGQGMSYEHAQVEAVDLNFGRIFTGLFDNQRVGVSGVERNSPRQSFV